MPISIKCLDCNTETTVSDAAAGKTARCPKCGNYIRVPGERIDVVPARSSFPIAPIVGALVIVALGCGVAWYLGFFNPPPPQPPLPTTPASPTAVAANTATETASSTSTGAATTAAKPSVENMSWADAPGSAIAVAGINQPSNLIQTWMTLINKMTSTNPMLASQWQTMRQKGADYLGVDLANPKNFAAVGIDIDKPMTIALLELDAKGEPTGVALSVGITSADAAMTMARRMAQKQNIELKEETSAQPTVYLAGTDAALTIKDNRFYFFGVDHQRENAAKIVRDFLVNKDRSPVREQVGFKAALDAINGPGEATAYVDLKTIIERAPGPKPAMARDLRSVSLKGRPKENIASLNLVTGSRFLRDLKPGAPCRDFVGKFDRPIGAITISLADPIDFLKYISESGGGGAVQSLDAEVQTATTLSLDEWGALLKGGNAGILVYKALGPLPVTFFGFVKVQDPSKLGKLRAAINKGLNTLSSALPVLSQTKFAETAVGDYVVFGSAIDQINRCATADFGKNRWEPAYGNEEIFAVEYFVGEMMTHLKQTMPALGAGSNPLFSEISKINVAIVQRGESLLYQTDSLEVSNAGLAIVAAIAIPSLLRSRMAANEMAAVASCRFFCEAQEIYHRTDYHGDGTLQYAQSLKGDFSLYEKKAGLGDLGLIDRSFAEAEGSPSQNPKPKAGYCFKVLTAQGPDAVGGKRNYIVNKRMLLGYALVAYPIAYDSTGRNTFLINGTGTIFQKDLGPTTLQIVEQMKEYNPDATWIPSR
jgi:hypothetical protein